MLQAVGIDEFEELVYRTLLRRPGASVAALTHELATVPSRTRRALDRLAELRLVHNANGGWVPSPPDGALDALIHRRESELASIRAETPKLLEEFRTRYLAEQPSQLLEVVTGRDEIHRRAQEARRLTQEELLSFDKPPYIAPADFDEIGEERLLLARHVRVRAIYCSDALARSPWPDRLPRIQQLCQEGEQARVLPSLPIKLTIYDRRMALVPLTAETHPTDSMVVVHQSGLLDGIIALFEAYWQLAHPIAPPDLGPASMLSHDERHVLAMLAAGLTDDAIARQLGVSTRTIRRRVLGILDALHASTRFQAGLAACRSGLVQDHHEIDAAAS